MNKQNAEQTKPNITSKITLDLITNLVFSNRLNGFFSSLFNGAQHAFITGSYVYKHTLRGEDVIDVDVIDPTYNSSNSLSTKILDKEKLAYHPTDFDMFSEGPDLDYSVVLFKGSDLKIDMLSLSSYIRTIEKNGLTMIGSLVLTDDGIKHILEIPEIAERVNFTCDDPVKEREWMIDNLKNSKYCKWGDMREKDVEYFSEKNGWTMLDCSECEKHGIFNKA